MSYCSRIRKATGGYEIAMVGKSRSRKRREKIQREATGCQEGGSDGMGQKGRVSVEAEGNQPAIIDCISVPGGYERFVNGKWIREGSVQDSDTDEQVNRVSPNPETSPNDGGGDPDPGSVGLVVDQNVDGAAVSAVQPPKDPELATLDELRRFCVQLADLGATLVKIIDKRIDVRRGNSYYEKAHESP